MKRSFGRIAAPLLVLLLVVVTGGATVFAQSSTLVIGTGAEASSLDPRMATDVPSFERIR